MQPPLISSLVPAMNFALGREQFHLVIPDQQLLSAANPCLVCQPPAITKSVPVANSTFSRDQLQLPPRHSQILGKTRLTGCVMVSVTHNGKTFPLNFQTWMSRHLGMSEAGQTWFTCFPNPATFFCLPGFFSGLSEISSDGSFCRVPLKSGTIRCTTQEGKGVVHSGVIF